MKKPRRTKVNGSDAATYLLLSLYALIIAAPLLLMLSTALKRNIEFIKSPLSLPKALNFSGFTRIFTDANFLLYLRNSALVTLVSLAVALVFSVLLSYALARFRGKWVMRWYFFFLVGMIIPIRLGVLFLNDMLNWMGLLDSLWGLILIYIAMTIPFSMFILTGYIKMIPPELDEAAVIDGCTTFRMISRVIVPLLKPALATVAIYNFMPIWNDVYFPLVFLFDNSKKTFMLHVTMFFGQYSRDYNLIFSALTFATLVSLVFYAFGSRYLVRGLTAGALKG